MDLEQSILNAIDIVASKRVAEAGYNKTIQGVIVSCEDETIGKYKIKYQDGYWYAFSNNIETKYTKGTSVYILVPNGDMNNDKTILGSTSKLGIDYIDIDNMIDHYSIIGTTVSSDVSVHELCSYSPSVVTLYDENNPTNILQIDKRALREYIKSASHLLISMMVQTNLPIEQRYNGNYGLKFYISFLDNSSNQQVIRTYTFDISQMTGDPYIFTTQIEQQTAFVVDGANFQKIQKIEMFCENFPHQEAGHPADIFLSSINIYAAEQMPQSERNGISLNLIARKGLIFTSTDSAETKRTIEAQVRLKNKVVPNTANNDNLKFYWFKENNKITSDNLYYTSYGGQGWQCLNQYVIITQESNTPTAIDFNSGPYAFEVQKSEVFSQYTKYKCVVIYGENIISKEFTIVNESFEYNVQLISDKGTQFINDTGYPTLTCSVKNNAGTDYNINNFDFIWSVINNDNVFVSLTETSDINVAYNILKQQYDTLKEGLENGTIEKQAYYSGTTITNEAQLVIFQENLQTYDTIQRIEKNKIYNVNINQIVNFSTYKCGVFIKNTDNCVGTGTIKLVNTLNVTAEYTLIINNGSLIFNYNEAGVAPTNASFENPYVIPQLDFTIYSRQGQILNINNIPSTDIEWWVPINNTMLVIDSSYTGIQSEDGNYMIYNSNVLNYNIANSYSSSKPNNNIQLRVKYQGVVLITETNFTFTKQGENGTNGTEYQIKIVPNTPNGVVYNDYPVVYYDDSNNWYTGWQHVNGTGNGVWFRVELWHNGVRVFNGTATGVSSEDNKEVTVTWSILQNVYNFSTYQDNSCLTINASTGRITFNGNGIRATPANIVQVEVKYNDLIYYATMPVITVVQQNTLYRGTLIKNTGFRYAIYKSDGTKPSYDSHAPFEILVEKKLNNNKYEDISTTSTLTYTWEYKNKYYSRSSGSWIQNDPLYLTNGYASSDETLPKNQKIIKPVDGYDGQTVNNAVVVTVKNNNTEILYIHIPIHLMFNRYENAALNGWNGNSIDLGEQSGMILAPQIGAGIKDNQNKFTGLVMGKVSGGSTQVNQEVGLFGYHQGQRSIFLDASTGKAVFGKSGAGQIILDPSQNQAIIRSSNYGTGSSGSGMQINLTIPEIRYGNSNFLVDSSGILTAKGAEIQGKLYTIESEVGKGSKGSDGNIRIGESASDLDEQGQETGTTYAAIYTIGKPRFSATSSGFYLGTNGLSLGSDFSATAQGQVEAKNIRLIGYNGQATLEANRNGLHLSNGSIEIYKGSEKQGNKDVVFSVSRSGRVVINNGTINMTKTEGSTTTTFFKVNDKGAEINGKVTAKSGEIGGWTINTESISRDTNAFNNIASMYFGKQGLSIKQNFVVTDTGILTAKGADISGTLTAQEGKIGPWYITSTAISRNAGGTAAGEKNTKNNFYFGTDGLSLSNNFVVDSDGTVHIKNGEIIIDNTTRFWDVEQIPATVRLTNSVTEQYAPSIFITYEYNSLIRTDRWTASKIWTEPGASSLQHKQFMNLTADKLTYAYQAWNTINNTKMQEYTQSFGIDGIQITNIVDQTINNVFRASRILPTNKTYLIEFGATIDGGCSTKFNDNVYFAGDEHIYISNRITLKNYISNALSGLGIGDVTKAGDNTFAGTNTFNNTVNLNSTVKIDGTALAQYCKENATQTTVNNYTTNYAGFGQRGTPSVSIDDSTVISTGAAYFCIATDTTGTLPWSDGYFFLLCFSISANSAVQLAFRSREYATPQVKYRVYNSSKWSSWFSFTVAT